MGGLVLMALAAIVASCESDVKEEVKQFAVDFATKVSNNDKAGVTALYADAAKADSLAIKFVADSVSVTEAEGEGKFKVSFGPDAEMLVTRDAEGKMTVTESRGLFAWPADTLAFAKGTGLWEAGFNDVQLAERMADKGFRSWLVDRFVKDLAKNLKVKGDMKVIKEIPFALAEGTVGATVVNNSPYAISGDDYVVVFRFVSIYAGMAEEHSLHKEPGKDVGPNSSVMVTTGFGLHNFPESAYVDAKISHQELFNKYYKPTGNEYKEYTSKK